MATKFTLAIAPTFKAKVDIPVPGGRPSPIEFTFKHKTRDDFKEFIDGLQGREDIEVLQEILSGWALDDAFTEENLDTLVQNYPASARAITEVYITESITAKRGN